MARRLAEPGQQARQQRGPGAGVGEGGVRRRDRPTGDAGEGVQPMVGGAPCGGPPERAERGVERQPDADARELRRQEALHDGGVVRDDDGAVQVVQQDARDVVEGRGTEHLAVRDAVHEHGADVAARVHRVAYSSATRPEASTRTTASSTIRSPPAGERPVVPSATTANGASTGRPGPSRRTGR